MEKYRYDGSREFVIKDFNCADKGGYKDEKEAETQFKKNLDKINELQQKLYAEKKEGIIFVFQAMDAAGKDGCIRAVLSCLSPQGVAEHSFKVPSDEELRHDYLWRFWKALPEKGGIAIFNRSYYEDVLTQKVHKYYKSYSFADRIDMGDLIDKRYEQIRNFEKYLWENSVRVVKIFLNVSKDEQARRFISRIDTVKKNWKVSKSDVDERKYWNENMEAFEDCVNETSWKHAPWYVVPADHKWYARLVVSEIIRKELSDMDPKWPKCSDKQKEQNAALRAQLVAQIK